MAAFGIRCRSPANLPERGINSISSRSLPFPVFRARESFHGLCHSPVVNGNNGNAVEISPAGKQLFTKMLIRNGAGDLFGITTAPAGGLLAVNDGKNVINIYNR
jgi:hypothetical protein